MLNIYKSSAGSGKTYTLVREYLRLAFADTEKYRHILAITFTNKAAAEMKSRIIEALEKISSGDDEANALTEDLCTLCGKREAQLREEAGKILRHMLHHYSDISVSTIDSFVHRIVRSFTYDLHLPMNFDIEMDSKKLLNDAVSLLLDRLNEDNSPLTQAVLEFANSKMEDGRNWNIEYDLVRLGNELFKDDALPFIEELGKLDFDTIRNARAKLYEQKKKFETKLFTVGKTAFQEIEAVGYEPANFHQGTKGLYGFFAKYANEEFPNDVKGNKFVLQTIQEGKWGKSFEDDNLRTVLRQRYEEICTIIDKEASDYFLAELLLKNYYAFILLVDLQQLLQELKTTEGVMHIGDFQHKVFEIVKEQDAPIIYERIGEKYDNILIDEFQDTSVMQWRNLLPLIENSQFKSEDSLVVGDGKQAIYRFRGGEVAQFAELPDVYGSDGDALLKQREVAIQNYGTKLHNLEKNFRSCREIIQFNNDLYAHLSTLPELKSKVIYKDATQKAGKEKQGGFISIEFLPDEEEPTIDEVRNDRVLEIVHDCLTRGYAYKDIAVLTRSNAHASLIATHLLEHDIRVVSPESLLIQQSPKVNWLLSAFRYLNRKDDVLARAEMMHYMLLLQGRGYTEKTFKLPPIAEEFEHFYNAESGLQFDSSLLHTGRLTDLTEQLIQVFQLDADDPFLQFFLDEVLLFASRYGNRLADFLDWWETVKQKKSIIYPDSMDAVRIMTIHKSKGLQFPVVILADACETQSLGKDFFWVPLQKDFVPELHVGLLPRHKTMQQTEFATLYEHEQDQTFLDMLNLLYVGTTRPEDALYVLSKRLKEIPKKNNSVTALLYSFLFEAQVWDDFKTVTFGHSDFTKEKKESSALKMVEYEKKPTAVGGQLTSAIQVKLKSEIFWSDKTNQNIERGKVLHEAFKRIKYAGEETKVVERLVADGLISSTDSQEFLTDLQAAISHPQLQLYFRKGATVINERKLLKQGESVKIPDRVVIENNEAVVIDYKTGEPNEKHKTQVNDYAHLLQEAGIPVKKKLLYYLPTKTLEEWL